MSDEFWQKVMDDHRARIAELERQLSTARADALREAAEAAGKVYGGPSAKVSENSYVYSIQDGAVAKCVAAIRALIPEKQRA